MQWRSSILAKIKQVAVLVDIQKQAITQIKRGKSTGSVSMDMKAINKQF